MAKLILSYIIEVTIRKWSETMEKDYQQLMTDLRDKTIDSFVITPDEFMTFQVQYRADKFRQEIVGTAKRGGEIEYHLEKAD